MKYIVNVSGGLTCKSQHSASGICITIPVSRIPFKDAGMAHPQNTSAISASRMLGFTAEMGIQVSMSREGICDDNAMVESFFSSFKTECVDQQPYQGRAQAKQSIFEWIEVFYNRQRRHSSLDYLSPVASEQQSIGSPNFVTLQK